MKLFKLPQTEMLNISLLITCLSIFILIIPFILYIYICNSYRNGSPGVVLGLFSLRKIFIVTTTLFIVGIGISIVISLYLLTIKKRRVIVVLLIFNFLLIIFGTILLYL